MRLRKLHQRLHSIWLGWKLENGVAYRGRGFAGWKCSPKTRAAKLFHLIAHRKGCIKI